MLVSVKNLVLDFKTFLFSLASKNLLHLKRSIMLNIHFIYEASGDQLRIIANYIEAGKIKPVIDRVFPFEDAQKQWNIQRLAEQRKNNCKIK